MTMAKNLCLALVLAAAAAPALAQDAGFGANIFYFGAGQSRHDGALDNDDTPFSLGLLHRVSGRKLVVGFDIGREGTMIDSTWGLDDKPKQAMSYNLLLGGTVLEHDRLRADAALLLGARESFADCPDSYLGYQCYADSEPDTEYKGNFGAVLTLSFDRFTTGLRATGESTQLLAGFRF